MPKKKKNTAKLETEVKSVNADHERTVYKHFSPPSLQVADVYHFLICITIRSLISLQLSAQVLYKTKEKNQSQTTSHLHTCDTRSRRGLGPMRHKGGHMGEGGAEPSLNCKVGLCFSLSNTWDQVLRRFPSRRSRDLQH